ncbi:MAG: hydroxylamine reductase, partial [Desulfobacteraceae bacterium]
MFCYQCEQTAKGEGCTKIGVCGKTAEVAALQDLLLYALKGLALVANAARRHNIDPVEANRFTLEATFSTLTNVDFDPARFAALINRCVALREELKKKITAAGGRTNFGHAAAAFAPAASVEAMVAQGEETGGVKAPAADPDAQGLRELLIYGLKGVAAYADHAWILGKKDESVYAFIHEALAATLNPALGVNDYLGLVLKCGEVNLKAMELLDAGNTGTYGHPTPTPVPLGQKKGKAILVSGHDLKDLEDILKQSAGKGIFVYTHGEMLPCHGYPELKQKHPHFFG